MAALPDLENTPNAASQPEFTHILQGLQGLPLEQRINIAKDLLGLGGAINIPQIYALALGKLLMSDQDPSDPIHQLAQATLLDLTDICSQENEKDNITAFRTVIWQLKNVATDPCMGMETKNACLNKLLDLASSSNQVHVIYSVEALAEIFQDQDALIEQKNKIYSKFMELKDSIMEEKIDCPQIASCLACQFVRIIYDIHISQEEKQNFWNGLLNLYPKVERKDSSKIHEDITSINKAQAQTFLIPENCFPKEK